MRKYIFIIIAILSISCSTEDNYIDTGISNGKHDCSIYEYLHSNSYNWDSTVLVIERAGLVDIFEGKDSRYPQITFFGPTNHSITRFMLQNNYKKVSEIPTDICKELILKHVVNGKFMKKDIEFGFRNIDGDIEGGTHFTCIGNNILHAYKLRESWGGVDNSGAIRLFLISETAMTKVPMASPDIEPNNGVVHALNYTYTFGEI